MTSDNQTPETQQDYANYETLGEPETILVGKTGFVEVAHKRATLKDGTVRDFVLIARGYFTRNGAKRTQRLVTIPTLFAGRVASVLAAPERSLANIAAELGA
jgi:hypothetical protein